MGYGDSWMKHAMDVLDLSKVHLLNTVSRKFFPVLRSGSIHMAHSFATLLTLVTKTPSSNIVAIQTFSIFQTSTSIKAG